MSCLIKGQANSSNGSSHDLVLATYASLNYGAESCLSLCYIVILLYMIQWLERLLLLTGRQMIIKDLSQQPSSHLIMGYGPRLLLHS